jgi:hypothetical protein
MYAYGNAGERESLSVCLFYTLEKIDGQGEVV